MNDDWMDELAFAPIEDIEALGLSFDQLKEAYRGCLLEHLSDDEVGRLLVSAKQRDVPKDNSAMIAANTEITKHADLERLCDRAGRMGLAPTSSFQSRSRWPARAAPH